MNGILRRNSNVKNDPCMENNSTPHPYGGIF